MSLESFRVIGEEGVDQAKELHDTLVLPQVLMALQKEHEVPTIAACRANMESELFLNKDTGSQNKHQCS